MTTPAEEAAILLPRDLNSLPQDRPQSSRPKGSLSTHNTSMSRGGLSLLSLEKAFKKKSKKTQRSDEFMSSPAIFEGDLEEDGFVKNDESELKTPRESAASDLKMMSNDHSSRRSSDSAPTGSEFTTPRQTGYVNALVDYDRLNEELAESLEYQRAHAGLADLDVDTASPEKIKQVCRDGLTHSTRRKIWLKVSGAADAMKQDKKLFAKKYKEAFEHCSVDDLPSVPLFGHSSSLEVHFLTDEGVNAMKRILVLVHRIHYDLTFCPYIVDLAAVALGFMTERETFYLLHSILKMSAKDSWYLPLSAKHFAICTETIRLLIEDKLPVLYAHMTKVGVIEGMSGIFKDWLARGFVAQLPRYTMLRVMDTYLNEGMKIFYRVSMGILKLHQDELLTQGTSEEFLHTLAHFSRNLHDGNELLQLGFSISMSRKDIVKLQGSVNSNILNLDVIISQPSKLARLIEYPKFNSADSEILTKRDVYTMWHWMPANLRSMNLKKLYSTSEQGYHLPRLYKEVQKKGPLVFVLKTTPYSFTAHKSQLFEPQSDKAKFLGRSKKVIPQRSGSLSTVRRKDVIEVFGFFVSDDLICNGHAVVDRLLFLFQKLDDGEMAQYTWQEDAKDNDVMYVGNEKYLAVSGSGVSALFLRGLSEGTSNPTNAYRNPSLSRAADGTFTIAVLEVWGFADD
eukprot:TRINITY_DN20797_c0_g1_i1.p1 TRINITY_DN20797_c0_g1~~TRINITY_DN20797_c0_g1_i1.p1  ORF type:complete len:680 (+),score=154.86 TRINITY_DN20797_c0_g1_i1:273-2312(+)